MKYITVPKPLEATESITINIEHIVTIDTEQDNLIIKLIDGRKVKVVNTTVYRLFYKATDL